MRIPTAAEISEAQQDLREEGAMAPTTLALGKLCLHDRTTRDICEKIAEQSGVHVGAIMGAFLAGFNLGLRIRK